MSETRARASLLARWLGSFDRNGLSGRRAPSPVAGDGDGEGGGACVRGGVAGRAPLGTNGGADGAKGDEAGAAGVNGNEVGAAGTNGDAAGGVKGGTAGGGVNSGSPDAGEGGVAVAATEARSTDSGLGRDAGGTSEPLGGGGGGGEAGRAAGVFWVGLVNGGGSHASDEAGVDLPRD